MRSVRSECLAKIIPLGECHLRLVMTEFTEHYHRERNQQGLDNQLLEATARAPGRRGPVRRRERLGGVLNYYYRGAA